jgi:hypothetical protein
VPPHKEEIQNLSNIIALFGHYPSGLPHKREQDERALLWADTKGVIRGKRKINLDAALSTLRNLCVLSG